MGLEQGLWQYSKKKGREGKKNHGKKLERARFDAQSGNPHTDVFVCVNVRVCVRVFCRLRLCSHGHTYGR